jgi:hypothetical protein
MKKQKTQKILYDDLRQDAWDWFNNLSQGQDEDIVIDAYMKHKGITGNDITF